MEYEFIEGFAFSGGSFYRLNTLNFDEYKD
jgi:hypothetical protein